MDLAYFLNLTTVTVNRHTLAEDGMGGVTSTVTSTILSRATIYQEGSANRFIGFRSYLSDKVVDQSSFVLICEPSAYTWTNEDKTVTYNGRTFDIQGTPYNVMEMDELMVIGLRERV